MNLPQGAWQDPGNPIHQSIREIRYIEPDPKYCDECGDELNENGECDYCKEGTK